MSCSDCEAAQDEEAYYPFRIGKPEIGYGIIRVKACPAHAKLLMEMLKAYYHEGK